MIFDPEDGVDTFLRNVSSYTDYTALYAISQKMANFKLNKINRTSLGILYTKLWSIQSCSVMSRVDRFAASELPSTESYFFCLRVIVSPNTATLENMDRSTGTRGGGGSRQFIVTKKKADATNEHRAKLVPN
jgi:hypothetical protein